jgi:hypothetical protein
MAKTLGVPVPVVDRTGRESRPLSLKTGRDKCNNNFVQNV